ncbi:hypothetical protein D3C76_1754110 [compost metagenome]
MRIVECFFPAHPVHTHEPGIDAEFQYVIYQLVLADVVELCEIVKILVEHTTHPQYKLLHGHTLVIPLQPIAVNM